MSTSTTLPAGLTLEENSAVALTTAAAKLDAAHDADQFAAALDYNHRLWVLLREIAERELWTALTGRLSDFVVATSHKAGSGVSDDHVEALIDINRDASASLIADGDLSAIRRRAVLAWQEGGWPQSLERWLLGEIHREARMY